MNRILKYKSKVDIWLIILILLITFFFFFTYTLSLIDKSAGNINSIVNLFFYIFIIFVLWVPFFNTYYVISDRLIKVRSSFFYWEIPVDKIVSIQSKFSLISAPALSLHRLKITYLNEEGKNRYLLISPKNKSEFLDKLSEISNVKCNINK